MVENSQEILQKMVFSNSSINTYLTCPYSFKLNYLEKKRGVGSIFSEYGIFCHSVLERYFKGQLDIFDLSSYYEENYYKEITQPFPGFMQNSAETYYQDGLSFFETFSFNKEKYEIKITEDKINRKEKDFSWVVKPDLVLFDRQNKKYILYDYKTEKLTGNKKQDEEKIERHKNQFYLYAYSLLLERKITIEEIIILYIRNKKEVSIPISRDNLLETFEWFSDVIAKIRLEKDWQPNLSKENKFFCDNICSFRKDICEYRK